MPLQQTVGNVPLQNMEEDEAPLPEFEEIDGNELLQQMDQETEVAQSEQLNNGGDKNGENGQVLHPPTYWSVIKINIIDFRCCSNFFLFAFSIYVI